MREFHVMLSGYHEQVLDRYELAGFQAILTRNAKNKRVRKVSDLFKRPATSRVMKAKAEEHEELAEKLKRNKAVFDDIEKALRQTDTWKKGR